MDSPSEGTLSDCLGSNSMDGLSCKYTPLTDFTGTVRFSYKANDGSYDSVNNSDVEIQIFDKQLNIVKVDSSYNHSCVLYENKKMKCWGRNNQGQLGYGDFLDRGG